MPFLREPVPCVEFRYFFEEFTFEQIIGKAPGEGDCGEATNRGEEACECVGKLTKNRRQPHSRQLSRGYEQKPHRRPTTRVEPAVQGEDQPKDHERR